MHLPNKIEHPDITDEVINQGFLMLSSYYQYRDWAKDLLSGYPLNVDMSIYEDELFNNFYFIHRRQQIGMLPNPLDNTNSLRFEIPLDTRIKAFLSNVKYELKRNFNDKEIVNKILNLNVIDQLISVRSPDFLHKYSSIAEF